MGLRSDIVATLTSSDVALTDFRLFGRRICGADFAHVAGAVRNGQIQVLQASWDADRGRAWLPTRAAYNKALNCFIVGATPSQSLVVHEATHAINDWHGRTLRPVEDEGLAYVAEMVYVCRQNPAIARQARTEEFRGYTLMYTMQCGSVEDACTNSVIGYATRIAAVLIDGEVPDAQLLRDFQDALHSDPATLFRDTPRVYNHIERVEIPADLIAQTRGRLVTD